VILLAQRGRTVGVARESRAALEDPDEVLVKTMCGYCGVGCGMVLRVTNFGRSWDKVCLQHPMRRRGRQL
jgi:anaerobic selenocysteine-containing dehydrogenase